MKNIITGVAATVVIALAACNNNATDSNTEKKNDTVTQMQTPDTTFANTAIVNASVSIQDIITGYLQMKNAFTADNTNDAAAAGKSLQAAFINFDTKALSVQQAKTFNDIADDAKEHAEHIGANGGNIAHQREHFDMLSKDMADLVKTFGNGGQTLYKDFCPMYNNGKGAYWISEVKEIKNPYLGKTMPSCGEVKEEMK